MKTQLKTLKKEKTHVSSMAQKYDSNRATILADLDIDLDTYREIFFEVGIAFVESIYPVRHKYGEIWSKRLLQEKEMSFWNWFEGEFKIMENTFIDRLNRGHLKLTVKRYFNFIYSVIKSENLEKALITHIKNQSHVKL